MEGILFNIVVYTMPAAILAWICTYISRPFLRSKWSRVCSQSFSVLLLLVCFGLSKSMDKMPYNGIKNIDISMIVPFLILVLVMKFLSMYLIASYAKTVEKTPYWSFVAVLSFGLSLPLMAFGLWRKRVEIEIR